jgi:hypothetical protein
MSVPRLVLQDALIARKKGVKREAYIKRSPDKTTAAKAWAEAGEVLKTNAGVKKARAKMARL